MKKINKNIKRAKNKAKVVTGFLSIIVAIIVVYCSKDSQIIKSVTGRQADLSDLWQKVEMFPPRTNDLVNEILDDFERGIGKLSGVQGDTNLTRLITNYQSKRFGREQLHEDLKKLSGLEIDFIGQFHESLDSEGLDIEGMQKRIANFIIDKKYEVVWVEDFSGGAVVTADTVLAEINREMSESDLSYINQVSNPATNPDKMASKRFIEEATPFHASFQLMQNPEFHGLVRAVDYLPVKAVQHHLMEYSLPPDLRYGIPSPLNDE